MGWLLWIITASPDIRTASLLLPPYISGSILGLSAGLVKFHIDQSDCPIQQYKNNEILVCQLTCFFVLLVRWMAMRDEGGLIIYRNLQQHQMVQSTTVDQTCGHRVSRYRAFNQKASRRIREAILVCFYAPTNPSKLDVPKLLTSPRNRGAMSVPASTP